MGRLLSNGTMLNIYSEQYSESHPTHTVMLKFTMFMLTFQKEVLPTFWQYSLTVCIGTCVLLSKCKNTKWHATSEYATAKTIASLVCSCKGFFNSIVLGSCYHEQLVMLSNLFNHVSFLAGTDCSLSYFVLVHRSCFMLTEGVNGHCLLTLFAYFV